VQKRSFIVLAALVALLGVVTQAQGQTYTQALPQRTRILFLLDGSGSMYGQWENTTRIVAAKRLLVDLVDSLETVANLQLGLRVYGHQYHRSRQNCYDTKLEVPFGPNNHTAIRGKLMQLEPQGVTPIAYSLEQAANDFPQEEGVRNIIIIITDGIESCDGDPCAVSLALQRKNVFLKPFVIGLGMTREYQEEFSCLGQFIEANRIRDFRRALGRAIQQSLAETTVSVELLDDQGRRTEKDVNVTFLNNFTQEAAYEFVHYRDRQGRPDSVEVDGVLSYDLVINTIPPVIQRNVNITPGRHNVLEVAAPQGFLQVRQSGHTEYKDGVEVLIRKAGETSLVHVMEVPEREKLLVGRYDLEVLTTPKTYFRNVPVSRGETQTLDVASPGLLNVESGVRGIGSIYQFNNLGQQRWVCNLDGEKTRQSLPLQPGKYKLVFRSEVAGGSKYTEIREFTIRSGGAVSLKLFGR